MISERVFRYWDRVAGQPTFHLGLGLLRAVYGAYWLYAASWKVPPDFGQAAGTGLWRWISQGDQFPTFSWYHGFLESIIIPHFNAFGYLVLLTELLIGLSLFLGAFTRLGTAIGLFMSANITLTVTNVPGESIWFYVTLIGLHLLLGITRSGRFLGLDAGLARRLASAAANGSSVARLLVGLT